MWVYAIIFVALILAIVAILIRQYVYSVKIKKSVQQKDYNKARRQITASHMHFGAIIFVQSYQNKVMNLILSLGKLMSDDEEAFLNSFKSRAKRQTINDYNILIFLALRDLVLGNPYPQDIFRFTNSVKPEAARVLLLLKKYDEKKYDEYLDGLHTTYIENVDMRTLMNVLAQKIRPEWSIDDSLASSKYYYLLERAL